MRAILVTYWPQRNARLFHFIWGLLCSNVKLFMRCMYSVHAVLSAESTVEILYRCFTFVFHLMEMEGWSECSTPQIRKKLQDGGLPADAKLTWKKQPDGRIFHKKNEKKEKKERRRRRKRKSKDEFWSSINLREQESELDERGEEKLYILKCDLILVWP